MLLTLQLNSRPARRIELYTKVLLPTILRCGSTGARWPRPPSLTLSFEAPKLSIFGPYLIFPYFFASFNSAYHFFNMLLFHSSNSKFFQPPFIWHMISHIEVFVFSLSFTHFRLLGVHLALVALGAEISVKN